MARPLARRSQILITVVVDTSVLLPLIFPDEDEARSKGLMRAGSTKARLVCPKFSMIEFGQGIVMGLRRNRIDLDHAMKSFSELDNLPISFRETLDGAVTRRIGDLAIRRGISFYDAVFLELARSEASALATFDGPLSAAANAEGVPLWPWTNN